MISFLHPRALTARTFFLFITTVGCLHAQTPFSLDSATAYVRVLSVEIGPRPMGSPSERRAMEFAVSKFREFGLDEAYSMPFTRTQSELFGATNTNSGIAIGVLRGATNRIIVLGGHIDSAGPDIPGANDNGSGSATVIELARVLSMRRNESTLVFALFGGEEQGLRGSRHFVEHFADLDNVVLMLQIDMANGSERLFPTLDASTHSAPEWLVRASYEEFDKLGYSGLTFPTHFFTLSSSLPGGGVGSDHLPFLEKRIPAIDFTSDPTDPIHTPQDSFENFEPSGLKRSGDLVYRLVERFDGGVPDETEGHYYLYQVGSFPVFVPIWALRLFILLSLLLTAAAWWKMRREMMSRRREQSGKIDSESDPVLHVEETRRFPGLKLFLFMLIIQTCVWFSENVVGLLKGTRSPWLAEPAGYFVLGFVAASVGVWISLQLAGKLRLSFEPYSFYFRAASVLIIFLALLLLSSVKIALYPATALFFLALAMFAQNPFLKFLFWLASPHFMYRLIFSEAFELYARSITAAPIQGIPVSIILHVVYILFFSLWSFPFLLGFAAIYRSSGKDILALRQFRTRWGVLVAGGAFLLCAFYLSTRPTYSKSWKQIISVDQRFDRSEDKGSIDIKSSDYLSGALISSAGRDTTISTWTQEMRLKEIEHPDERWLTVERSFGPGSDSTKSVDMLVKLSMKHRPYTLTLTYTISKGRMSDAISPLAYTLTNRTLTFRWYSFPDTSLVIPLQFSVSGADSLQESVEAVFVEDVEPIGLTKEGAEVIHRSTVRNFFIINPPEH